MNYVCVFVSRLFGSCMMDWIVKICLDLYSRRALSFLLSFKDLMLLLVCLYVDPSAGRVFLRPLT